MIGVLGGGLSGLALASRLTDAEVLEALATGKPVAGANSRAIPEFVEHGTNGYLFNPDSPREAAKAVLLSLEHRDEMKDAARETALDFSVDACTRRLETVYDGIVAA